MTAVGIDLHGSATCVQQQQPVAGACRRLNDTVVYTCCGLQMTVLAA